ncbi:MAG: hypothetical protein IJ491_00020 [Clostridia bacterium]|nr:hypothetical protein [Clostridia bacterium]
MIKRIISLMLTLLMCLSLAACGSKGSDAQIIYPIDSDPEYLDPQIISDVGAKNIIANCFEGLVTIDGEGNIAPGCAESWSISPDGLTYTFRLREDCEWRVSSYAGAVIGDNYKETFDTKITAEDFVFAFRRALRPETKSPGAKNLYSIKNATQVNNGSLSEEKLGVKATGNHTLVITLEWADPDFLYTLLEPACMPCDETFFELTGGRYGLAIKYLLYNGPFYISNWADDTSISLRRNEKYYDSANVKPASIYFSMNNEQATRLDKIKNGTYDVAPLTADQASEIADSKKYSVAAFPSSVMSLIFNCKDENLNNINIRRAIAASFDVDTLRSQLGELTADGIIPSSMILSGEPYRQKAEKLSLYTSKNPRALLEKGLLQTDKDDIEVTVLCSEAHEEVVRMIMQSWQSTLGVNFNVFVEAVDEVTLQSRTKSGDYQIALCPVSYSSVTAFNGVLRFSTDSAHNICNFSDSMYDQIIRSIKTADGSEASLNATLKAEKYLISSCVLIPLYEQAVYYGIGKNVSSVTFTSTGEILYFKNTLAE